jgi:ribokinase
MKNLDILCCGELTIDEISIAEKIVDSQASSKLKSTGQFYGGRGGNFSVYSSLFGARVGVVAAIGRDLEGSRYRSYLNSKNINTDYLFETARANTSKCFIFNDDEKTRIFFYGGALKTEYGAYLDSVKDAVKKIKHDIIYCTSPDQEMNQAALINSDAETKIYAPSSNIYMHPKESVTECLRAVDVLFLNQTESDFLEKQLEMSTNEMINEFKIKILIKTLGKAGSRIITRENIIDIPSFKPEKVLDSSGAGDAFAGAFVANYLKTKDLAYSGRIASAAASFVVEEVGCQTNIPTPEKIMKRAQKTVIT